MTSKILDLYQVQGGTESSDAWGTPVAQTVKFMGVTDISINPSVTGKILSDKRGSLEPAGETELVSIGGSANMKGIALYDDLPYIFDALFGTATATGADPYTYTYDSPNAVYDSDLASPRVTTLAFGEEADSTANSLAGATLTSMSLACELGSEMTYDANFIGKQVNEDAMDTCSDREVSPIMGSHFKLYIDPSTDTVGTTEIENSFFAFTLAVDTHRALVRHMGSLTSNGYRDAQWSGTLALSMECDAVTEPYLNDIITASGVLGKAIRLKATSGTKEFTIDFYGDVMESPSLYTARDGVVSADLVFTGNLNIVADKWFTGTVVNSVASLA